MLLAIRDALFERLTGSKTNATFAAMPDAGFAAPAVSRRDDPLAPVATLLDTRPPSLVPQGVAIYPYDLAGTSFNVWPALSVYIVDRVPRTDFGAGETEGGPIIESVEGSKVTVDVGYGRSVEGYTLKTVRPFPEPFEFVWTMRIWARSDVEVFRIEERLFDLLDTDGYLTVVRADGCSQLLYTRLEHVKMLEVPPGILNQAPQGEFTRTLKYVVEGHRDTSQRKTTVQTVLSRELSVSNETLDAEPEKVTTIDTVEIEVLE